MALTTVAPFALRAAGYGRSARFLTAANRASMGPVARAARYKLPRWLTYANLAAGWKQTRSVRARLGSINRKIFGKSRKRLQGKARAGKLAAKRAGLPVPKTPSSGVPARYAVAPRMTKFKKPTKKASLKQPKSAIVHYKEYGQYNANQCMYINHEHIGSLNKMWFGIALGLSKALLARAKVYPAKSIDDPMIGPRTQPGTFDQYDNKSSAGRIRLVFAYNTAGTYNGTVYEPGTQVTFNKDVFYEDNSASPDEYRPFSSIARDVADHLMTAYHKPTNSNDSGAWLSEAQVMLDTTNPANVQPIYVQNLDDAEIHLYVNSLVKFQNITIADHGFNETGAQGTTVTHDSGADLGAAFDKNAIDANPLIGRVYSAKGLSANIDTELGSTFSTLDTFFQARHDSGLTLCGSVGSTAPSPSDLSRIQHIPTAKEIYGPQSVTTGHVSMGPGSMKFHKTSFSMVKTFKELSNYIQPRTTSQLPMYAKDKFRHTLFGFKCAHKHGADRISVGYNREQDVGCYIKITKKVFPLKAAYNKDMHTTTVSAVPSAIYNEADGIDP